jgi:hypothetical protein
MKPYTAIDPCVSLLDKKREPYIAQLRKKIAAGERVSVRVPEYPRP